MAIQSVPGTWGVGGVKIPDFGVTEYLRSLAGKAPSAERTTTFNNPNVIKATVGSTAPYSAPKTLGAQTTSASTGGGGGGGGSTNTPSQPSGSGYYNGNGDWVSVGEGGGDAQARAEEQARKAIEAAIGVFDAKKQGILNRIPGLEKARDIRLQGLDTGLSQFTDTANREEASRVAGLEDTLGTIDTEYAQGGRKVRATSKALANQLRNMYSAAGTLDSTQFRDKNFDNMKEVLQMMGDLNREKAGKVTSTRREQDEIKDYYSAQRTAEVSRVNQAKEMEKTQTDSLIQGIYDDATLTDAQKVEAIVAAQGRLDERLGQLDQMEYQLKSQAQKDAQDLAIKQAELQGKQYSSSYKNTLSIKDALNMAMNYEKAGLPVPAGVNSTIQSYFGTPKEDQFSLYGQEDDQVPNLSSW